jgi:hypothetical protein
VGFASDFEFDYVLKVFPKEFPFGAGTFSCPNREGREISWEDQMRWMMEQSHGRFAGHEIFMFVIFNILQRRKICLGAKLVTQRNNLPRVTTLLRDLDYQSVHELINRDIETGNIRTPTNPVLRQLMESTAIANGLVRGSQQYIQNRRNEIREMFMRFGGPQFFITINPDDLRHPLVLSLRGDVSHVWKLSATSDFFRYHRMRSKTVADNPTLQATFFDTIFRAVVDVLFGFGRESKVGIFGQVVAHYDMIKSQGKGRLHAHGLIWLKDGIYPPSPPPRCRPWLTCA